MGTPNHAIVKTMANYRFKTPLQKPKLITIQGQARGGKGTLARALHQALAKQFRVYVIDQGLKFRIFAKMALDAEIDYEDIAAIHQFVTSPKNKAQALALLQQAAQLSKSAVESHYYTHLVSNVSGMFGKVAATHDVVVEILLDEVRAAAGSYDIIMIDGRAMQTYGEILHKAGVVDYTLAVDVVCEPLTAARRVTGIHEPVEDLSQEQLVALIKTTQDISRRNSSDARRERDPSVYLHGTYDFDVLHPPTTDAEFAQAVTQAANLGAITVDNSFTRSPEQLTGPTVKLITQIIDHAVA